METFSSRIVPPQTLLELLDTLTQQRPAKDSAPNGSGSKSFRQRSAIDDQHRCSETRQGSSSCMRLRTRCKWVCEKPCAEPRPRPTPCRLIRVIAAQRKQHLPIPSAAMQIVLGVNF